MGSSSTQGSDGCNHVWVTDKTTNVLQFDFSTQVAGDPNFRDEGLTCDTNTFGKDVMWSKEAYSPMRAHAFEVPANSCGQGGQPVTATCGGRLSYGASTPNAAIVADTTPPPSTGGNLMGFSGLVNIHRVRLILSLR